MYRSILCFHIYSQNAAVAFEISGYLSQMVPFIKPVSRYGMLLCKFAKQCKYSGSRKNEPAPCCLQIPIPFYLHLHVTGTYFSVKGLCTCFAIDRDMFRKILISYEVLANSSLSCAFSNK